VGHRANDGVVHAIWARFRPQYDTALSAACTAYSLTHFISAASSTRTTILTLEVKFCLCNTAIDDQIKSKQWCLSCIDVYFREIIRFFRFHKLFNAVRWPSYSQFPEMLFYFVYFYSRINLLSLQESCVAYPSLLGYPCAYKQNCSETLGMNFRQTSAGMIRLFAHVRRPNQMNLS